MTLHPLPTAGGFMDSHIIRKAAARLPALADLAVLRFNTRGTTSPRGTSEGSFGEGVAERADVAAAMAFVAERGLPNPWLVGWSFGTELALKYGLEHGIAGAILLSPPLHRTSDEELRRWNASSAPIVALIPEHDDYLRPAEAAERFAVLPRLRAGRRRGRQAPLGGGVADAPRARGDRRRGQPVGAAVADTWPPIRRLSRRPIGGRRAGAAGPLSARSGAGSRPA